MARNRTGVAVGGLFRKTNSTNWLWQVHEIFTPAGHWPHARLIRPDYPAEIRVFSLSALRDSRLFVPAGRTGDTLEERRLSRPRADVAPFPGPAEVRKAS